MAITSADGTFKSAFSHASRDGHMWNPMALNGATITTWVRSTPHLVSLSINMEELRVSNPGLILRPSKKSMYSSNNHSRLRAIPMSVTISWSNKLYGFVYNVVADLILDNS